MNDTPTPPGNLIVLPAAPGTEALVILDCLYPADYEPDDYAREVRRLPVIGWRTTAEDAGKGCGMEPIFPMLPYGDTVMRYALRIGDLYLFGKFNTMWTEEQARWQLAARLAELNAEELKWHATVNGWCPA